MASNIVVISGGVQKSFAITDEGLYDLIISIENCKPENFKNENIELLHMAINNWQSYVSGSNYHSSSLVDFNKNRVIEILDKILRKELSKKTVFWLPDSYYRYLVYTAFNLCYDIDELNMCVNNVISRDIMELLLQSKDEVFLLELCVSFLNFVKRNDCTLYEINKNRILALMPFLLKNASKEFFTNLINKCNSLNELNLLTSCLDAIDIKRLCNVESDDFETFYTTCIDFIEKTQCDESNNKLLRNVLSIANGEELMDEDESGSQQILRTPDSIITALPTPCLKLNKHKVYEKEYTQSEFEKNFPSCETSIENGNDGYNNNPYFSEDIMKLDNLGDNLVGLENIGNSCYLNSLLQILQLDNTLYNNLYKNYGGGMEEETVNYLLYKIFTDMRNGTKIDHDNYKMLATFLGHNDTQRCVGHILEVLAAGLGVNISEKQDIVVTENHDFGTPSENAQSYVCFAGRAAEDGTKDKTAITFPETITTRDGRKLNLVGYILHHGDSSVFGHYTAIKLINGKWYCCNDNRIYNATKDDLLNSDYAKQNVVLAYYQ